jgi:hypothetical protein
MLGRWVRSAIVGILVLFLVLQVVPYGRNHSNPVVRQEPAWDSQQTRQLVVRACFDCRSNKTVWPWCSYLAPGSWLVQRDVQAGRSKVNFSEWDRPQEEADESVKATRNGTMPPWYYPWGRLSAAEREALLRGLEAPSDVENKGIGRRKHSATRGSDLAPGADLKILVDGGRLATTLLPELPALGVSRKTFSCAALLIPARLGSSWVS